MEHVPELNSNKTSEDIDKSMEPAQSKEPAPE